MNTAALAIKKYPVKTVARKEAINVRAKPAGREICAKPPKPARIKIPNVATDIMPQATPVKPAIKRWLSVKLMLAPATIIPNVRPDMCNRQLVKAVKPKNSNVAIVPKDM